MIKYPTYILALVTTILFSVGYLYEYAYLDVFGIRYLIFTETYANFLLYSFHVLLFQFLLQPNVLLCLSAIFSILTLHISFFKYNLKYRSFIEKITTDWFNIIIAKSIAVFFIPIFLFSFVLIPVHFGTKEAKSLKDNIDKQWQVIHFKDKTELDGILVRKIGNTIIIFEKNDTITRIYDSSDITSILYRTK